jgi:hypothetical protein
MNLVLFDDALEHLTRIHRVIRMDQGHALLVGVGGSGKQSLCRLASFAAGCDVFEITLSRGYGESSFRDDLKILYNKLGMENKKTVFLFTDQHVAEEGKSSGKTVPNNYHLQGAGFLCVSQTLQKYPRMLFLKSSTISSL